MLGYIKSANIHLITSRPSLVCAIILFLQDMFPFNKFKLIAKEIWFNNLQYNLTNKYSSQWRTKKIKYNFYMHCMKYVSNHSNLS